jgi:hypothetical protein
MICTKFRRPWCPCFSESVLLYMCAGSSTATPLHRAPRRHRIQMQEARTARVALLLHSVLHLLEVRLVAHELHAYLGHGQGRVILVFSRSHVVSSGCSQAADDTLRECSAKLAKAVLASRLALGGHEQVVQLTSAEHGFSCSTRCNMQWCCIHPNGRGRSAQAQHCAGNSCLGIRDS